MTAEFKLDLRSNTLRMCWLDFEETFWEIQSPQALELYTLLSMHMEQGSRYQTEAFQSGSSTHKWVWYYEAYIPSRVKFQNRLSEEMLSELRVEDYGQEAMQAYIKQQLRLRKHEFTDERSIKMWVGTWNTAGRPPTSDLADWVQGDSQVYAFCLQEMCKLQAKNLLGDDTRKKEWVNSLLSCVATANPQHEHVVLWDKSLMGLLIVIVLQSDLLPYIKNPKSSRVKLGFKGYAGNKGAVSIRFEIFEASICVINCHLAPHKNQVSLRNTQVKNILKDTKFFVKSSEAVNVYEHDYIFWAGDFNYRLNFIGPNDILYLVANNNYSVLLANDQFNEESKKLLPDFVEAPVNFQPTFKYHINSQVFNTENGRDPAYCDRIICRGKMTIEEYNSCQFITHSDHRPIYASYSLNVHHVDQRRLSLVRKQIFQEIDLSIHLKQPRVALSSEEVIFQDVKYKQPQTLTVVVQCISEETSNININLHGHANSWLHITPTFAVIKQNESVELSFTALFTEDAARKGNANQDYLHVIAVLSVSSGSDHFISVHANFRGSCFGAVLEDLVKIEQPISHLDRHIKKYVKNSYTDLGVPKELLRMIKFIQFKGIRLKGLFDETGDPYIISEIRSALDSGEEFSASTDAYSMCKVMLEFLDTLAKPVLPPEIIDHMCKSEKIQTREVMHSMLIDNLSSYHARCFLCIMNFLELLAADALHNGLHPSILINIFLEPLTHAEDLRIRGNRKIEDCIDSSVRKRFLIKFFVK